MSLNICWYVLLEMITGFSMSLEVPTGKAVPQLAVMRKQIPVLKVGDYPQNKNLPLLHLLHL